jgi:pimeloyl-ACP methyl ester carboxylesterase
MWEDYFRDAYAEVADGPVPVLFLWGDSDNTIPLYEVGEQIRATFAARGASCIMIPHAGHGMMLEFPEQTAQHAAAWFLDKSDDAWKQLLESSRLDRIPFEPGDDASPTGASCV